MTRSTFCYVNAARSIILALAMLTIAVSGPANAASWKDRIRMVFGRPSAQEIKSHPYAPTREGMSWQLQSTSTLAQGKPEVVPPTISNVSYQALGVRQEGGKRLLDVRQVITDGKGQELYQQDVTFVTGPAGMENARLAKDQGSAPDPTVILPRKLYKGLRWTYQSGPNTFEARVIGRRLARVPGSLLPRLSWVIEERATQQLSQGQTQEITNHQTYARGTGLVHQNFQTVVKDAAGKVDMVTTSVTRLTGFKAGRGWLGRLLAR